MFGFLNYSLKAKIRRFGKSIILLRDSFFFFTECLTDFFFIEYTEIHNGKHNIRSLILSSSLRNWICTSCFMPVISRLSRTSGEKGGKSCRLSAS